MNDQIHQRLSRFSQDYKQFTIQMNLIENHRLQITVVNNDTFVYHSTMIDRNYIANEASFTNIIECPSDIIEHASNHFNSVVVRDGQIIIDFPVGKKSKEIKIQLKRRAMDQSEIVDLKLHKMKKLLEGQLHSKDLRIKALEERVKNSQEQIFALKKQLLEIVNRPTIAQTTTTTQARSQQNQSQQVERRFENVGNNKLGSHPQCPHKQHFKYMMPNNSLLTIERHTSNAWYNFTNIYQIKTGEVNIYRVKIKKLTKQYLGIGFGTKSAFGNVKASHPEGIFYLCNGNIYEFGSSAKSGKLQSANEDIVETECDLKNNTVWWWKNGKKIGDSKIPRTLFGKSFYFMTIMHFEGDTFQLSQQK